MTRSGFLICRKSNESCFRNCRSMLEIFYCKRGSETSDLEFQTSQYIVCWIFDVHLYLMDIF